MKAITKYFALLFLFIAGCKTVPFQIKDGKTAREFLVYNQSVEFLLKEYNAERDPIKQQQKAFQLAESYKQFNDYANAEKWYKQSIDLNGGEKSLLQLGLMQKQQEKYEEAYKTFDEYQRISSGGFEGRRQANQCKDAIDWKKSFTKIQLTNLSSLNTPSSDYGLEPFKNNQYVLTSSRDEAMGTEHDGWTGEKFTDLFVAEKTGAGFSSPVAFPATLNSAAHESSVTFSKDCKEIYFVRCKAEPQKENQFCHLYYSALNNEHWSEPVKMDLFPDSVNVYDPYLSKDGKILLAAADGIGFGATDIFLFTKADSGWNAPQNLGGSINTPYSERFPWLDERGNLYFSSNGLPGMGGLDIFRASHAKNGFKEPFNLKNPINSGADDFAYRIEKYKPLNTDDTVLFAGYLSSNRKGGKGSDDIYRFEEKWKNFFVLKGTAYENIYENPTDGDSKIKGLKPLSRVKIELKKSDGTLVGTTSSDTVGRFQFRIEGETEYKYLASKSGYFSASNSVASLHKNQDSTLISAYTEVTLGKIFPQKMLVIPNIYYDYDKATLRPESKLVLDSIMIFFKENPDLTIELGSHTDSRGSDAYNLKLSQARAQSAVDYLISKGIPTERLLAKGYGETKLVNSCGNNSKCTEEDHQKNRRTTFRVASEKLNLESIEPENILIDPKKE